MPDRFVRMVALTVVVLIVTACAGSPATSPAASAPPLTATPSIGATVEEAAAAYLAFVTDWNAKVAVVNDQFDAAGDDPGKVAAAWAAYVAVDQAYIAGIDAIDFRDPKFPIVSSLTGKVLTTAEEVRQELSDQMTGAINWMRAFLVMRKAGASAFFEVGPGHVLANITKRLDREARMIDIFDDAQWIDLAPLLPKSESVETRTDRATAATTVSTEEAAHA